jgi:tetratricopeptide (TPR) repeat protein
MWYADTLFSRASALFEAQKYQEAYSSTKQAVNLFPSEPIYRNQYSQVLANLSLTAFEAQEATLSQTLANMALSESDKSLTISPFNVNFWKARTKVFYTLGQIEESFFQKAIEALLVAKNLSPTDPKITYNLGLLQNQIGDKKAAISAMEETIELKPDYRDAHFALSLFYKESGFSEKAREELKYILEKINPMDEEAKKKLEEWK